MKLDFPITVIVADGNLNDIGMPYASAGFDALLHNRTRTNAVVPTIAEWIDFSERVILQNPFGVFEPMMLEAYRKSLQQAWGLSPQHPEWEKRQQISKRLDLVEFVWACKKVQRPLTIYIGSPLWAKTHPGDSQARWVERFQAIVEPYMHVADEILFDNYLGSRPTYATIYNGDNGAIADAFRWMRSLSVTPGLEPFAYARDVWLSKVPKLITVEMFDQFERNKWASRPVDCGQAIQVPGSAGEKVYLYHRLNWQTPAQEKVDYLNRQYAQRPTFTHAVNAGVLPVELLN